MVMTQQVNKREHELLTAFCHGLDDPCQVIITTGEGFLRFYHLDDNGVWHKNCGQGEITTGTWEALCGTRLKSYRGKTVVVKELAKCVTFGKVSR